MLVYHNCEINGDGAVNIFDATVRMIQLYFLLGNCGIFIYRAYATGCWVQNVCHWYHGTGHLSGPTLQR
jgi:hypothetical protein